MVGKSRKKKPLTEHSADATPNLRGPLRGTKAASVSPSLRE